MNNSDEVGPINEFIKANKDMQLGDIKKGVLREIASNYEQILMSFKMTIDRDVLFHVEHYKPCKNMYYDQYQMVIQDHRQLSNLLIDRVKFFHLACGLGIDESEYEQYRTLHRV
jgi:hypothetical protein